MEEWKPVRNWEEFYMISNKGRLLALEHTVDLPKYSRTYPSRIIKPRQVRGGYLQAHLKRRSNQERVYVHRLVAHAFLSSPEENEKMEIDHIDGNPHNNCADNLQWVSHSTNMFLMRQRRTTNAGETLINPNRYCECGEVKSVKAKMCIKCFLRQRRKRIPEKNELLLVLLENGRNYSLTGRKYGVTGAAVKKWCRRMQI